MLNHSTARQIAEKMWGKGGTTSYRTNRRGAFYFSCAGHGGFIIDGRAFSPQEIAQLTQFVDGYDATEFRYHGKPVFMHPWRTRGVKYNGGFGFTNFKIFLFEEDCDWCLPVIFAGIRIEGMTQAAADQTFWDWFDHKNPKVQERKRRDEARAAKSSDLIVSACRADYGQTLVTCADGRQHFLDSYDHNHPWLHLYQGVMA